MPALVSPRFERLTFCLLVVTTAATAYWLGRSSSSASGMVRATSRGVGPTESSGSIANAKQVDATTAHGTNDGRTRSGFPDRATIHRQMLAALNEPISTERWMMLAATLHGLSAENWRSAWQALDDERRLHGKDHTDARAFLVRRAGEVVGLDAITFFLGLRDRDAVASALTGWASKQPTDALEWLARREDKERSQLTGHAIRGLSLTEPDLAISYLEQTPPADRQKYSANLIATIERTAGLEQTQHMVNGMLDRARSTNALGQPYLSDVFRDLAEIKVRRARISGDVGPAMTWVDQHVGQPYVNYETIRNSAGQLAQVDAPKALAWLESVNSRATFPASISPVGYGTVLSTWVNQAGLAPVGQWLQNNQTHTAYDRMASYYVEFTLARNPQLALPVAAAIKDPTARATSVQKIQQAVSARGRAK